MKRPSVSKSSVLGGPTALQLLRLFNRIRLAFGLLLIALSTTNAPEIFFSSELLDAPVLWLGVFYFIAGLAVHRLITHGQQSMFIVAYISCTIDIVLIAVLLGLGGLESGFQSLLVIPSLAGALLLRQPHTYSMAAACTLVLLSLYTLDSVGGSTNSEHFVSAGAFGITLFAIALAVQLVYRQLSDRADQIEAVGVDLANVTAVNELVIQNLEHGVIVCDSADNVKMSNQKAFTMLGLTANSRYSSLRLLNPDLAERLSLWRLSSKENIGTILINGQSIAPSFRHLDDHSAACLIYLRDADKVSREAQRQKLASLGQLTASIAHEIRNPLAAIASAGQLLEEGEQLSSGDKRLVEIIRDHCIRVNTIIENVLQLSSRQSGTISTIQINPWLEKFVDDYCTMSGLDRSVIKLTMADTSELLEINSSHLEQILRNLLDNAVKYGNGIKNPVRVITHFSERKGRFRIDILDQGPGIPAALRARIFEPFYTAGSGTGLGLYIANELASVNGGRLSVENPTPPHQGAHFRLSFNL